MEFRPIILEFQNFNNAILVTNHIFLVKGLIWKYDWSQDCPGKSLGPIENFCSYRISRLFQSDITSQCKPTSTLEGTTDNVMQYFNINNIDMVRMLCIVSGGSPFSCQKFHGNRGEETVN